MLVCDRYSAGARQYQHAFACRKSDYSKINPGIITLMEVPIRLADLHQTSMEGCWKVRVRRTHGKWKCLARLSGESANTPLYQCSRHILVQHFEKQILRYWCPRDRGCSHRLDFRESSAHWLCVFRPSNVGFMFCFFRYRKTPLLVPRALAYQ